MKKILVVSTAVLLLLPKEGFAEEWNWFCEVEYSAGIVTDGKGQWYSGKMVVPEDSKHLLIREEKNQPESVTERLCRNTLNHFNAQVASNQSLSIEKDYFGLFGWSGDGIPREYFSQHCLAPERIIVKEIGKDRLNSTYYSYGGGQYFGVGPRDWFGLYGTPNPNPSFEWGVPLDAGPAVRTGHCKAITK